MEKATSEKNNRVAWIDISKFFVTMLVVLGHTRSNSKLSWAARGGIYSFHMPFFFIVGGMTFRFSNDKEEFLRRMKKSAKHLLIPVVVIVILRMFLSNINDLSVFGDAGFWKSNLYSLIFARGLVMDFGGIHVPAIGMPWFIFTYFIAREIFDYLHLVFNKEQFPVACVFTSILGMCCANIKMAFSIDLAMVAVAFLLIGNLIRDLHFEKKILAKILVFGVAWYVTLRICFPNIGMITYFELAAKNYSIVPISILCAVFGSFVAFEFSVIVEKIGFLRAPLGFFGKNAIIFFVIHTIDENWRDIWDLFDNQLLNGIMRCIVDLVIFSVTMAVIIGIKRMNNKKTAEAE